MFTGGAQRQRWVGNLAKGSGVVAAATVLPFSFRISEFSSTKLCNGGTDNNNNTMGPTAIAPSNSVHELLECPVCTNSMYPPIHQLEQMECRANNAEREAELLKEQLDHLKDQLNECLHQKIEVEKKLATSTSQ